MDEIEVEHTDNYAMPTFRSEQGGRVRSRWGGAPADGFGVYVVRSVRVVDIRKRLGRLDVYRAVGERGKGEVDLKQSGCLACSGGHLYGLCKRCAWAVINIPISHSLLLHLWLIAVTI